MKIRRIDFSPDEWLAGTTDLSNDERGVYITLCALIYSRDGPVETAVLRAFCPGDLRPFKRCLEHLVELGKIQRSGSKLSQKRCLNELEVSRKRIVTLVENGRKGGRPPKEINDIEKPTGSPSRARNHQPSTINDRSPRGDLISKPNGLERRAKPKKKRSAFPPDWRPDEQDADFARARGRDDGWIVREGDRCRDHHNGKGNVFADHHAAWRTWVMNAPNFERVNGSPARPPKTEAEQWAWHAENYANRRVMLNADERTSPMDPDGRWYNADLVAAAEAKMRGKHERH